MPGMEFDPIRFASHYGLDPKKLMATPEPKMTIAEAKAMLENLAKQYPRVSEWQKGIKETIKR